MSMVPELEAAMPKLSSEELDNFHAWIENNYEDRLELKDEVEAKLDQARQEIQEGRFRIRQAQ